VNRFKTMGIAIAMALALTAFAGAGTASAATFKAPGAAAGQETTWSGARSGANHKLSLGGDTFTCENVSFAGGMLGWESSEANVNPELKTCSWQSTTVSWVTNGCKLRFRANAGGYPAGTVDIYNCTKPMTMAATGCQLEVGNQNAIGTVEYKNTVTEGKNTIAILANLKNITYTRVGGTGCVVNKPGTFSDGTYTGEWTVKGTRGVESVPIEVGVPTPTKFAVDSAPATITGTWTGVGTQFKNLGGASCKGYSLSGTMPATSAESITVAPTYKECTIAGQLVPEGYVRRGSCSYVFHVNGTFDIAGANCATDPMTITSNGCITIIGPQSGITGTTFAFLNEGGWGALRTVSMSGSTGLQVTYTRVGPLCGIEGTFSNGLIGGSAKLSATSQNLWLE
jgi:hypothetical protein